MIEVREQKEPLDHDEVFEEFWKDIICHDDGSLNFEQIKRELADYYVILNAVPKVYDYVTGGAACNPMTWPSTMKVLFDDYVNELIDDAREDELDHPGMSVEPLKPPTAQTYKMKMIDSKDTDG